MRTATLLMAALALGACKKKTPDDEMDGVDPNAQNTPAMVGTPVAGADTPMTIPAHVQAMVDNFNKVFFEFDSSKLSADSMAALDQNAQIMGKHGDLKVRIEGHADERGTTDYNLALGQRRAESMRKYLISQGIGPSRLAVVSMGEEVPLVSGSSESAWSKNRRAEFVVTWGGEGGVQGSTE